MDLEKTGRHRELNRPRVVALNAPRTKERACPSGHALCANLPAAAGSHHAPPARFPVTRRKRLGLVVRCDAFQRPSVRQALRRRFLR